MSVQKVYCCDCCGFQSPKPVDFNNGPLNLLPIKWDANNSHYCNSCINEFNKAIAGVFRSQRSNLNAQRS